MVDDSKGSSRKLEWKIVTAVVLMMLLAVYFSEQTLFNVGYFDDVHDNNTGED